MPQGTRLSSGNLKIAISFPAELFHRLQARAWSEKKSFSATVCEVAAVGLFDLEESDAHEPLQIKK